MVVAMRPARRFSCSPRGLTAFLALCLTASACSSDSPSSENTETTQTEEGAQTEEAQTDEGAQPDQEVQTEEAETEAEAADSGASIDTPSTAGPGPQEPISAEAAIEAFGALQQDWTGPLTTDVLCAEFPSEHVRAVLGRGGPVSVAMDENACVVDVDDGHFKLRLSVSTGDTDEDWRLWVGSINIDEGVPLDVADDGLTSIAFVPLAAVRDGSIFWFVRIEGLSNADVLFTTETDLLREAFVVLTSRWSFDTQQGDAVQWQGSN